VDGPTRKDNGLVDEYGGLDKAIEIAKQLANIPANKSVQRIVRPIPPTFWEQLFRDSDEDETVAAPEMKQQQAMLSRNAGRRASRFSFPATNGSRQARRGGLSFAV
jgi:protease-4